jgi:hypothetical protein
MNRCSSGGSGSDPGFGVSIRKLLLRRVPDRYEHLVRYVGWYFNRARGERAKQGLQETAVPSSALATAAEPARRASSTWAKLIRKVYEADPLACPSV